LPKRSEIAQNFNDVHKRRRDARRDLRTRIAAIEILCRFAADNVEREATLQDPRILIPQLRYEAMIYAVEPLVQQARSNTAIAEVVQDLLTVPEFAEFHAEIVETTA
jgi:hypothetical protein